MSYNTKVRIEQGGERLVVESGGTILISSGATIEAAGGATITGFGITPFTPASAITDLTDSMGGTVNDTLPNLVGVGGSATVAEAERIGSTLASKVNLILAALRNAGIIAT